MSLNFTLSKTFNNVYLMKYITILGLQSPTRIDLLIFHNYNSVFAKPNQGTYIPFSTTYDLRTKFTKCPE
jgi:hypothetical protein